MQFNISATADTRYTFTRQFLEASAIFTRRARVIETAVVGTMTEDDCMRCEHRALVTTVIMQCVAALEAETHETCLHGPGSHLGSNGTNTQARDFLLPLVDLIDDQNALTRFDLILHLLGKTPLDKGSNPYQSVALVVRLRNELVHYKSRWGTEMERNKLLTALQSLKHTSPPFTNESMNFFPHRCLSAACATWALASVVSFLEQFYEALGVPNRFANYRTRLVP